MSITKSPGFQTSDMVLHATLEVAQKHELYALLCMSADDKTILPIIDVIVEKAEQICSILRATGRKPRKSRTKIGRPKGSRNKSVGARGTRALAANGNEEAPV